MQSEACVVSSEFLRGGAVSCTGHVYGLVSSTAASLPQGPQPCAQCQTASVCRGSQLTQVSVEHTLELSPTPHTNSDPDPEPNPDCVQAENAG